MNNLLLLYCLKNNEFPKLVALIIIGGRICTLLLPKPPNTVIFEEKLRSVVNDILKKKIVSKKVRVQAISFAHQSRDIKILDIPLFHE